MFMDIDDDNNGNDRVMEFFGLPDYFDSLIPTIGIEHFADQRSYKSFDSDGIVIQNCFFLTFLFHRCAYLFLFCHFYTCYIYIENVSFPSSLGFLKHTSNGL